MAKFHGNQAFLKQAPLLRKAFYGELEMENLLKSRQTNVFLNQALSNLKAHLESFKQIP